jgi:hypothetical protein
MKTILLSGFTRPLNKDVARLLLRVLAEVPPGSMIVFGRRDPEDEPNQILLEELKKVHVPKVFHDDLARIKPETSMVAVVHQHELEHLSPDMLIGKLRNMAEHPSEPVVSFKDMLSEQLSTKYVPVVDSKPWPPLPKKGAPKKFAMPKPVFTRRRY